MTDTPETDAARITEKNGCIATFCGRQVVPVEFARCLERARDWARKQWRLESARVSASLMAIESLERDRAEAQLLVKTLSDQCDMIEEDKEYNAQLANQFKSERDQLKAINTQLLEALEVALNDWQYGLTDYQADSYQIARDLLLKAKEVKS